MRTAASSKSADNNVNTTNNRTHHNTTSQPSASSLPWTTLCFAVALLLLTVPGAAAFTPLFEGAAKTRRPPVGTALEAVIGYNSTCPWTNVMRCAPPLKFSGLKGEYVNELTVAKTADGLPLNLSAVTSWSSAMMATTTLLSGLEGHYEGGLYDLTFVGTANISVSGDAAPQWTTSGAMSFTVVPSNTGIKITITAVSSSNPLSSIVVRAQAFAGEATRWNPAWLALVRNFAVVRMSHWQQEVYSSTAVPGDWSTRPSATWYTQVQTKGVSHEDMAALAVDAGVDLIISVPCSANDDYMRGMAALYAATGRKVYLVDSYLNGYIAVPTRRVDRIVQISQAVRPVFTNASNVEVVLALELFSTEHLQCLDPTSAAYNASFAAAVDAVSFSGEMIAAAEIWSSTTPNPYFTTVVAPVMNDPRRLAYERLMYEELTVVDYFGRVAVLNKSVYITEGGIVMATDMYGQRYTNASTPEAKVQIAVERVLWDYELSNPAALRDLWTMWMERYYRLGARMIVAGRLVSKGFECVYASTGFQFANRYQCYYRGLTRFVDSAAAANKLQGVLAWISKTNGSAIAALVDAPLQLGAPACSGACVWGDCDEAGTCVCHNGYSGATCEVFDESLLPNRCSPDDFGVNLNGGADWDPVWTWTNFMGFARYWIHQPITGYVWSFPASVPMPPFDDDGYPMRLDPDHSMGTFMRRDTYAYPHGLFHVFFDGDGTIAFGMDTQVVQYVRNGYIIVKTVPKRQLNNGLWFQIRRTNPDNHIRNIRVVPDAQLHRYRWQRFHPLFLESMKRFRVVRFMPVQRVQVDDAFNISDRTWADRTKPTFYSQVAGRDGMSFENIVALANKLHVRPWINIPYNADDGYVRNLTALLVATLNPRLRPIVEYGNEVWASDGYAGNYAQNMAIKLGLDNGAWVVRSRACYNQHRSRQIWRMMRSGGLNITGVLGAQAAYTGPLSAALECAGNATSEIEAVAIAPYFGIALTTDKGLMTRDEVFNSALNAINGSATTVLAHRAIMAKHNISTIFCYESGPSFFGGAVKDDDQVTMLGNSIHRDPRMKKLMVEYFNALRDAGSTVNMYFTGPAGAWSGYGAWGMREYQNQDPELAPKAVGYEDYALSHASCTPTAEPSGCAANCSGHGFCMPDKTCECYFSYRGAVCEEYWTIPDYNYCNTYTCPQSGGTCQATKKDGAFDIYTCEGCSSNFTGWMCQFPVCANNCSFNGRCVSPQNCSCFRGHMGATCEQSCKCGGHGTCTANGSCTCDSGYVHDGTTCVPTCACATCQGPNLCGCDVACLYGACVNGTCVCWAGFGGASCTKLATNKSTNSDSVMGINVAGVADWVSSNPFLNMMWRSREWFLRPAGIYAPSTVWAVQEPFNLTSDGYPAALPFDRVASTFITRDTQYYIPAGTYTMMWEGRGMLEVGFDASAIAATRASNFMKVKYTPSTVRDNGFFLTITATDPSDPIRNIRVYSPEYPDDGVARAMVFNPAFLADLAPFRVVRFMDWVNLGAVHDEAPMGNYTRKWWQRNSVNASSMHSGYGVSEEVMITLANWINVEPWFSVPHDADDEYVRNFATLIKYRLRPDVGIQIEHSNEVWNGLFESYKYAVVRGKRQFPNIAKDFDAAIAWHGFRSQQIFSIFMDVFGPVQRNRLRFKVGTFALMTSVTDAILRYVTVRPVFISSTGYFCDEGAFGGAAAAAAKSVDELIARCTNLSTVNDTTMVSQMQTVRKYSDVHLDLYENGPGLVEYSAISGGYSAPGVADTYRSFHLHSGMYNIVKNFLSMQRKLGVEQFNYFTSAAMSSIYGNWGIKESTSQSCSSAPKCKAVMDWMAANKDMSYRTVNWGLADFGFNNVVQSVFSAAPTQSQLDTLVAALEASMNLTKGSVVALYSNATTGNGTLRRSFAQQDAGNVTVYFIVTVAQASSTDIASKALTISQSLPQVASTSVGATVSSVSVTQPATVISPLGSLPLSLQITPAPPTTPVPPTSTPNSGPPVPSTTTASPLTSTPSTSTNAPVPLSTGPTASLEGSDDKQSVAIGVGVGGGALVIALLCVVAVKCCRNEGAVEADAVAEDTLGAKADTHVIEVNTSVVRNDVKEMSNE